MATAERFLRLETPLGDVVELSPAADESSQLLVVVDGDAGLTAGAHLSRYDMVMLAHFLFERVVATAGSQDSRRGGKP